MDIHSQDHRGGWNLKLIVMLTVFCCCLNQITPEIILIKPGVSYQRLTVEIWEIFFFCFQLLESSQFVSRQENCSQSSTDDILGIWNLKFWNLKVYK